MMLKESTQKSSMSGWGLTENGKQPVIWKTLVEVLRDIELSALADELEAVKCPKHRSQET